ncbi:MAG: metalloregulator ArsR/SmtB family transcription factor [Clostridium sp.]|nr:metalloregulator ArsR/SmtB family transcription factor [Clostridium sp.]
MKNEINICDCAPTDEALVEKVKNNMIKDKYLIDLSSFFKVLSDETRMRIVSALTESELCVSDIAVVLNMTKSAVSHQLKVLKFSGLVKSRKVGKNVYYSLDDDHVVDIVNKGFEHIKHKHM